MTERGIAYESIHYIEKPLSASELKNLLRRAGLKPHEVVRKNEPAYKDHVSGRNLSDAQLTEVMVKHPQLIQRPIVVRGDRAVLARPVVRLAELGIE